MPCKESEAQKLLHQKNWWGSNCRNKLYLPFVNLCYGLPVACAPNVCQRSIVCHSRHIVFCSYIYCWLKMDLLRPALSRATCASVPHDSLYKLHEALCYPGITRLNHFIRIKNLPYSLDEVKCVTSQCLTCAETKRWYHVDKPEEVPLIKATQPCERINVDFKGPLPSTISWP